ncbi:hypothetical protein [Arthrobacter sp. TMN-50]
MARHSEKVEFLGSQGALLVAQLDLPDSPPLAYALFAHCFTCSKDVLAAETGVGAFAQQVTVGGHRLNRGRIRSDRYRYRPVAVRFSARRAGRLHVDDRQNVC